MYHKPGKKTMSEQGFGKAITISEDVKYVGDGEDPANDLAFILWKNALISAMSEWVSVKDRLPEVGSRVLVSCDDGVCSAMWFLDQWSMDPIGSYAMDGLIYNVTHWMPLPEPPK